MSLAVVQEAANRMAWLSFHFVWLKLLSWSTLLSFLPEMWVSMLQEQKKKCHWTIVITTARGKLSEFPFKLTDRHMTVFLKLTGRLGHQQAYGFASLLHLSSMLPFFIRGQEGQFLPVSLKPHKYVTAVNNVGRSCTDPTEEMFWPYPPSISGGWVISPPPFFNPVGQRLQTGNTVE